jgi:tetratricopeptide (TPR) repeat protein
MKRGWTILLTALAVVLLLTLACANKYVTTGKIDFNAKRWDMALADFSKALETNPNDAVAHFYLAKIYAEKQYYQSVIQHLNAADTLDPKLSDNVAKFRDSIWYALAGPADSAMSEAPKIEKSSNDYFEAALGKISANQPDSATADFDRAKASLRIRENARAESVYTQAVDTAKAGQIEEARILFDSVVTTATREIYMGANDKFETAISLNPKKPEAYAKAGFAWFRIGDDDSSYYYYMEAYNRAPDNIEILKNLIRVAGALGKTSAVDSLSNLVLEKDPKNVEALKLRGTIAQDDSNYEDAVKYYKAALEINPEQCDIWFDLGVIYFQYMKKLDDAEQAFTQADNLCPDDANTIINLSVVLISSSKFDDAITRLTSFTDKNPNECVGWDLLSQAYLRKGLKDQAFEADKKFKDCKGGQ